MVQIPFLRRQQRPLAGEPEDETEDVPPPQEDRRLYPFRLDLTFPDSRQMISTQLSDCLLIGRDSDPQPDIDLSAWDSARCGVSRLHAAFLYDGRSLAIEDLNSRNGTRINGYRIEGGKPYPLRNGDELELGQLRMIVQLVRVPV